MTIIYHAWDALHEESLDKPKIRVTGKHPHQEVLFSLMRRYLVFTYYAGSPLGGFHDFLDSFSSVREALENLLDEPGRYFQIVDRNSMRIIRQGLTAFKDYSPKEFEREEG